MITIEYDPIKGVAVRDGRADDIALEIAAKIADGNTFGYRKFSTENVFYAIRVLIKKNVLDREHIEFRFGQTVIKIDDDGRCNPWPFGFCEYSQHKLLELL